MLSTAAPRWNNWARNPSFVVAMLDLQAHLAGRRVVVATAARRASRWKSSFAPPTINRRCVSSPPTPTRPPTTVDAVRTADGQWLATLAQTDRSGFYEAQLARSNGKIEIRREAVNVDPAEGDLRALFGPDLAARLQPEVKYQFDQAETFELALDQRAGYNLSDAVLYLLIALLIGEQLLAFSASYHPAAREKAAGCAGAATPRRRTMNAPCCLAAVEGALHTSFEWGRIQTNADWILPIAALLAAICVRPRDVPPRRRGVVADAELAPHRAAGGGLRRPADLLLAAAMAHGAGDRSQ